MKHAASILAIVVAAFIMGCQDSTITDPTSNMPLSNSRVSGSVPGNIITPIHTLALNTVLHEPGNLSNSFLEINGVAAYQTTVIPLDPVPPNPQYAVRLYLTANAEVRPWQVNGSPWHISGTSDNLVGIPESGTAFLTKSYIIEGRIDGMLLKLRFQLTLTSVELSSMWLELPRVSRAANLD